MSPLSISNPAPQTTVKTHAQKALEKLGLVRDIDFALHLPLRYEDETHITALRDARHSEQRKELTETVVISHLPSLADSLELLHHPPPDVSIAKLEDKSHPAWQRLKAEELLAQQLSQLQARRERAKMRAQPLDKARAILFAPAAVGEMSQSDKGVVPELLRVLPFTLTSAQTRVQLEISADLAQAKPMNRLLQGDVGSGKTVVAALAAAQCIEAGFQCALMVPTEILAQQHFAKLVSWLEPLLAARGFVVAWLSGTQKAKERREMLATIESGKAALVVGTHAIIQNKVTFAKLALVVVDEQHRFGVAQRLALIQKTTPLSSADDISPTAQGQSNINPHLLMMSATPIPRTLAMSYYADLDVSTIDELPPGRTPIVTKIVAMTKRGEVVRRIIDQLKAGRQVYWVCPLIKESEAVDLVNATQTHTELQATLAMAFPSAKVKLLHSKIPALEKKSIMQAFEKNEVQVLVSTTVIEVGVDVPNATLMVIEHAERFGLAQLHQLRGRVGRGLAASACVLLYATGESGRLGDAAKARLKAMVNTTDGFEIARRDLAIRGPGEFLGARQSGAQMLRFADLSQPADQAWLKWAQATAPVLLDTNLDMALRHVERWLPSGAEYMGA